MNDEDDFFGGLPQSRIAIVGLGLMGGSLALALRGRCAALTGVDPDAQTRALAQEWKVVERAAADPAEILPEADLIILAVPVRKIIAYLQELPRLHAGRATVIDLGSTKKTIWQAMQALPGRFDPIGGHPMCGKESSSLVNADASLYKDAPFALTPLPRTSEAGRRLALELVAALGARPLWLDPETHDRWVAYTSHAPYLVANAMAASLPPEAAPLVGPGLRSTTRLAGSALEMMNDILATNREPVLEALKQVRRRMEELETQLEQGQLSDLERLLADGQRRYRDLIAAPAAVPQ